MLNCLKTTTKDDKRLVGWYFHSLGDYSFISPHKCVNKKDYHSLGDLTRCKEFSLLNFSTYLLTYPQTIVEHNTYILP